jgi:acyl dehydratase
MKEFSDDDRLYLDDLQIGQRFTSGTYVVDEEQIKAFARQFDPQPFHLDNEAAKNTLLSGLAASGWHTAAITMRLLVESGMPLAGGIVGAGGELDWPNPTRPGDSLKVESEVLDIRPSRSRPDRGVAVVRSLTRNQRNEVVQCLTAKLIVVASDIRRTARGGGPRRLAFWIAPVRFCQRRGLKPYGFDGANCHPDARADLIGQVRS